MQVEQDEVSSLRAMEISDILCSVLTLAQKAEALPENWIGEDGQ